MGKNPIVSKKRVLEKAGRTGVWIQRRKSTRGWLGEDGKKYKREGKKKERRRLLEG